MISNLGFSTLFLLLLTSFSYSIFCFFSFKKNHQLQIHKIAISLNFLLSVSAFFCLIICYILSDFSVLNVYQNSHTLKPLIYKISGAWGSHEGSMLLLLLILNFYALLFVFLSKTNQKIKITALAIQSLIICGFATFIIFTSNPFEIIFPAPNEGLGLNPILQDIGLAMHPPMLYTGYIGFSLIFSIILSGLLCEKIDKEFAAFLKPWILFSWSFLTLGIGLGSWWAYRELGWGGFWFWDPVENVSLMPWFCATAMLHSISILAKNNHFKTWSAFLGILTFVFCLLGIFLVRSGIITSVHSFASDPARGIFIILLLLVIGGSGFLIFFFKSLKIKTNYEPISLTSRNGMILINNLLMCLSLFIIALGTLYPLALQLLSENSITIGAPYYNKLFTPISLGVLCLMILFPSVRLNKFSSASMLLSHVGIFIIIIAIFITALFSKTKELNMKFGDKTNIGAYEIEFKAVEYLTGENYIARQGNFVIFKNNKKITTLKPQNRYYPENDQTTTEASIKHFILSDLYLVMGGKDETENYAVRIYHKPFISFIWIGCAIIFIGGICGILTRRNKII